jgi:hypothetical protein
MTSPFDDPREVLDWAREGIKELDASCSAFLNTDIYRQVREIDSNTGQELFKIVCITKMPVEIRRKATEALSNTRHAFDQALFAACCAIGKHPKESIYFPWAVSPDDLEYKLGARNLKPGKQPKIPPEFWPRLRSFEPYRRGNTYSGGEDGIRALAQIANRKHTVRLNFSARAATITEEIHIDVLSDGQSYESLCTPVWDTVKNEIVLARYTPGAKFQTKYRLNLYVAFNEAAPLKEAPVVNTLSAFVAKAQSVIDGLEATAAEISAS